MKRLNLFKGSESDSIGELICLLLTRDAYPASDQIVNIFKSFLA